MSVESESEEKPRNYRLYFGAALLIWGLLYLGARQHWFALPLLKPLGYAEHGQVGDAFGPATALFAILAFLFSWKSSDDQRIELEMQRRLTRRQIDILAEQSKINERHLAAIQATARTQERTAMVQERKALREEEELASVLVRTVRERLMKLGERYATIAAQIQHVEGGGSVQIEPQHRKEAEDLVRSIATVRSPLFTSHDADAYAKRAVQRLGLAGSNLIRAHAEIGTGPILMAKGSLDSAEKFLAHVARHIDEFEVQFSTWLSISMENAQWDDVEILKQQSLAASTPEPSPP